MTPSSLERATSSFKLPGFDEAQPAICRAGYFQFLGGQQFTNTGVQSRGLFWCKSGKGEFALNGVTFPLEPHDFYVLPWNRSVTYLPDRKDPMYSGHVHIVPWYRNGASWLPNVPHEANEIAYNSPDRSDIDWPGFKGVFHAKIKADEPIGLLVDYVIRWFLRAKGEDEPEARHLGHLVLNETTRLQLQSFRTAQSHPEELRRMVAVIENSFELAPSVSDLAKIIGRSRSHVLKLFSTHLGISAKKFIITRQLQEARELLLSTTMAISEVGQKVGICDPYHFSKLFKRHVGIAPSEYRRKHGPFASPPKVSTHRPAPSA